MPLREKYQLFEELDVVLPDPNDLVQAPSV